MTISLFSKDAGHSLLIRRGTDSYGEEGRRQETGGRGLQYSVGNSSLREATPRRRYANGLYQQARSQLVQSEKMSVLGDLAVEVADKITAVFIYLNHICCRGIALLYPTPRVYLLENSCNNRVGLNAVNLQLAAYEVFYGRS
ncbi:MULTISPECIES: hypothetical protein [unclassified Nostoc]|uniref:hypothetical protein n=1 Tax=unclassified Nostoc TaxID=2593658 RepID=UPI0025D3636B|nr:hypothetical protein [Nostoc sp. JL33]MBN3874491.1 hypothetical protein [Nostoc sp. JL33]